MTSSPIERSSIDPDIEVVRDGRDGWPAEHAAVVVDYRSAFRFEDMKSRDVFGGFHLDADGTVWRYRYPRSGQPHCDFRKLENDPPARDACLYGRSKLVARLSTEGMSDLMRAVKGLSRETLVGRQPDYDEGTLTVTGFATRTGKPILVARCQNVVASQLDSPNARTIIEWFKRLRKSAGLPAPCEMGRRPQEYFELVPGVRKWSAP